MGGPGKRDPGDGELDGELGAVLVHAGQLEPPVEDDGVLGLEEPGEPLPVRRTEGGRNDGVRHLAADDLVGAVAERRLGGVVPAGDPSGWSIVTTASSAASSMARSCDSLARTASSACRRATYWPTWLPSSRIVSSRCSSGWRSSRVKNSIMPTTPLGLSNGNPNAACRPQRRAMAARGKFAFSGASTIHAGSPDCDDHAPGGPRRARG